MFGPDGDEIVDLDSWFVHAPPEKGLAQWTTSPAAAWIDRSGLE
jgi:hypothetical protein